MKELYIDFEILPRSHVLAKVHHFNSVNRGEREGGWGEMPKTGRDHLLMYCLLITSIYVVKHV